MLDKMLKVLGVTTESTVQPELPICDSYSSCEYGYLMICIAGSCEYLGECC